MAKSTKESNLPVSLEHIDDNDIVCLVLSLQDAIELDNLSENLARQLMKDCIQAIRLMRSDLIFTDDYA